MLGDLKMQRTIPQVYCFLLYINIIQSCYQVSLEINEYEVEEPVI
jgi:hypothetical protein